jgi:hypothetical protein
VHASRALLVLLVLSALPAHAETWSTRDVEAAERYRADERERAERYRAALERTAREVEEPRAPERVGRAGEARSRVGLGERLSDWLGARLAAFLGDLAAAFEDWLGRQLEALTRVFEEPAARNELRRVEREHEPLGDWLTREQARARRILEGMEARSAPRADPAAEREWAEREAARTREWAMRRAEREREPAPAPWEARWREAESWERIERERALRQLEAAREWQAEERERLERRERSAQ